ncbi:MAG: hypothetical protein WC054_02460 [Candidatus Nanopelagicales bacterium]
MTRVVIEYNRATGSVNTTVFDGPTADRDALTLRFALELDYQGNPDVEVVLLSGTLDQVQRTHARYFLHASDLVRKAG